MDWVLVTGCIPCAFVCDCCQQLMYRCSAREDMWVVKKLAFNGSYYYPSNRDYKHMLCGNCYQYKRCREHCCCKSVFENSHPSQKQLGEEKREVCWDRDGNKCVLCYHQGAPCRCCWSDGLAWNRTQMTYIEFACKWFDSKSYPHTPGFETFIQHNGDPPRPTYASVLKGLP